MNNHTNMFKITLIIDIEMDNNMFNHKKNDHWAIVQIGDSTLNSIISIPTMMTSCLSHPHGSHIRTLYGGRIYAWKLVHNLQKSTLRNKHHDLTDFIE